MPVYSHMRASTCTCWCVFERKERERESTLRKAQAMLGSSCGNTKALQSHIPRRGKKTSSKHFKILIISETEVQTSSWYLGYLFSLIDVFLSSIKLGEAKMAETQNSKALGSENFALYVIWNIKHGFFKHLCTCPIIFWSKEVRSTVTRRQKMVE